MFSISDIKIGKIILHNSEPFVVVKADHHKMGRGGAVLKCKLKNLISGNALEKTFQGNDKAEPADVQRKKANYMYKDDQDAHLMDNESFEQFTVELASVGDKQRFLKDDTEVDVLYFNGDPVSIDLPIKMQFRVTSAPPGVKGNSAGNVTKQIELETGATIGAPLFIEMDEEIIVNTDTGEYVERANK